MQTRPPRLSDSCASHNELRQRAHESEGHQQNHDDRNHGRIAPKTRRVARTVRARITEGSPDAVGHRRGEVYVRSSRKRGRRSIAPVRISGMPRESSAPYGSLMVARVRREEGQHGEKADYAPTQRCAPNALTNRPRKHWRPRLLIMSPRRCHGACRGLKRAVRRITR